ncbi:MAG: F0F1 ATP synthase subunit A [Bacteroidales bacterium]|nr:F0F1 ATP synthase subunit A [Bacteroidales bacterium]
MTDTKTFIKSWIFLFVLTFSLNLAAHDISSEQAHHESEKFVPGSFIMDHIADAYEWHIVTIGETHISIPLPVILYSKTSGLHVFMSNKFHHGHEMYDGFMIARDGEHEKKIVEVINGEQIKPIDLSISKNVVSLFVSVLIMLWIFFSIAKRYSKNPKSAPKGLQSMLEPIIIFVRDDVAKASIGEKRYMQFTPFLLTIFFFIFINNLMGLIPIFPFGANLTGNIAITMVLALFTFVITTFIGNKAYWTHIFNAPGVPWWLKFPIPLMPLVEVMGVFIKPFVLMVRLFANITAGHIIALGFYSLIFIFGEINATAGYGVSVVSVAFTIFMMMLELLVAFIQAYVFTLLSALYFGMAIEEHH